VVTIVRVSGCSLGGSPCGCVGVFCKLDSAPCILSPLRMLLI
jgi:hypothetical protein